MGRSDASAAREAVRARSTRKYLGRRSAAGVEGDGGEAGQGCLTGHPAFTAVSPAFDLERMPEGGGYPVGFIQLAGKLMGVTDYSRVLHVCSGSVRAPLAVDYRPPDGRWACPCDHGHLYEQGCSVPCAHEPRHDHVQAGSSCSVVGDARRLPIRDASVRWVMADPPYDPDYAEALWQAGKLYPTPAVVLREAARVLRPGGMVAFLHHVVPPLPETMERVGTWGVTTGPGYRIRALTIARRLSGGATLFGDA